MKLSENGINMLKEFEGFKSIPYLDSANVPTIGYGSTFYANNQPVTMTDAPISEEQAHRLMIKVLARFELAVNDAVKVPINQNQFDALVLLTYNIGIGAFNGSTLLKELNKGNYSAAAGQFKWWRMAGGKVLKGLVTRRAKEKTLFLMKEDKQMETVKGFIGTLLRHGGNALGVWLVSKGYIDAETATSLVDYLVGGGLIVVMAVWSYFKGKNDK